MCNGSRRDSQWTIVNPESPDNGNSYDTCSLHATSTSHAAFHTPGRSQWLASTDVRAINAGELSKCYTETNMMTLRHYSNTDLKQRRNDFVHNTTTTHTAVRESNTTHQSLHAFQPIRPHSRSVLYKPVSMYEFSSCGSFCRTNCTA